MQNKRYAMFLRPGFLASLALSGSFALSLALMACGSDGGPSGNGKSSTMAKRIFISSTSYTGGFGGLAQGDSICQSAASTAGIGGSWKAWLSTSTTNAINRINDVGPWYSVDGKDLIFQNKTSMITSNPLHAIVKNETGATNFTAHYWTGTSFDGTAVSDTCSNWTTSAHASQGMSGGGTQLISSAWTWHINDNCDSPLPLLCIEQ